MVTDKKVIEEVAKRYCKETGCTQEEASLIREGFIEGAYWGINEFLKDSWHDADEEPDYLNRRVLIEYKPKGVINAHTRIKEVSRPEALLWKDFGYRPTNPEIIITRWCYIEDLLTKEGGEK